MEQKRLGLYTVDIKLIRNYCNQGDKRVMSVSPQIGKANRPFVGLIVICERKQYCVPLSSPKAKHQSMKNDVDFHKILDGDGKLIGVLNFNNMIPVNEHVVEKIDLTICRNDSPSARRYKMLMIDQVNFCRKNQDIIVAKANKLYRMINRKNASGPLKRRCLNWNRLEEIIERYI